jgi:hypothetical protein
MPAKKSAEKIPFLVSQVLGPRRAARVAGWRSSRSAPHAPPGRAQSGPRLSVGQTEASSRQTDQRHRAWSG